MQIAILHGPRDLRIEDHPLETQNLGPRQIWTQTRISALKIGTDRGNFEGAEQVPGAPDFPRWVGDSNLGIVRGVGSEVTEFAVGDRVRRPAAPQEQDRRDHERGVRDRVQRFGEEPRTGALAIVAHRLPPSRRHRFP